MRSETEVKQKQETGDIQLLSSDGNVENTKPNKTV